MNDTTTHHTFSNDETPPEVPDLELIRCIGRGGFGQVWMAKNRTTGRMRAVKLIALDAPRTDLAGREIVGSPPVRVHGAQPRRGQGLTYLASCARHRVDSRACGRATSTGQFAW